LTALCKADLRFFTDKDVIPSKIPSNVAEVLEMATTLKADGQTAPAASLYSYYSNKQVIRMFIIVTDEVENIKYKGFYFPELFYKYYTQVYPARIVFVSFLDNPSLKGRMVTALEAMGIIPIQFKLDGKRPDLSKLDHILAVLAMESEKFPSQVEEVHQVAQKSAEKALKFLEQKRKKQTSEEVKHGKEEVEEPKIEANTDIINKMESPKIEVSTQKPDETQKKSEKKKTDTKEEKKNDNNNEQKKDEQKSRNDKEKEEQTVEQEKKKKKGRQAQKEQKEQNPVQQKDDEPSEKVCIICLDKDVDTALVNCGHLSFCQDCSRDLVGKECPICRSIVITTVRIYQS